MPGRGHLGAQTKIVVSPAAAKRARAARLAEEKRWAERSGPVTVIKPTDREAGE